jgi:hypothetical protein
MELTNHIKNVCKIGQGNACCRYLTVAPNGWNCEKLSSLKTYLDNRVTTNSIVAQGDNCEGKTTEFLNAHENRPLEEN